MALFVAACYKLSKLNVAQTQQVNILSMFNNLSIDILS